MNLGDSKTLDFGAYVITWGFMLWALYNALTLGWDNYTDYLPFLPKGFRIFAAWPYSILIFGGLALYCIRRYGWPGLFMAAFINQLWELAYDLTPAVFYVRYCPQVYMVPGQQYLFCAVQQSVLLNPHFLLYIGQAVSLLLFSFAIILQFRGYSMNMKPLIKLFIIQWLFSIATWPWSVYLEFLAEVFVVGLFFLLEVPKDPVSLYGQTTDTLDKKFFDSQTEQGFSIPVAHIALKLKDLFSPSRVLDVGCGKGFLVRELNRLGVDTWGIDKSEYAISRTVAEHTSVEDITKAIPYSPETFDLVTCIGVLQYIETKATALREMRHVLKPGGHLFVVFALPRSQRQDFTESVEHIGFKFLPGFSKKTEQLSPYILGRKFGLLSKWPFNFIIPRLQKYDFSFLCFEAI